MVYNKNMARRRGVPKFKLKDSTVYTLSAVLLWGCAILVWLSFTQKGSLLIGINNFLIENLGGLSSFFLPFPFVIGGMMVSRIKTSLAQANVFVGSLMVLGTLTGLSHSGEWGNQLWNGLATLVSTAGAGLFLGLGLMFGIVVMFNIPFEDLVDGFLSIARNFKSMSGKNKLKGQMPTINPVMKIGGMSAANTTKPNPVINDSKDKEVKKAPLQMTINPPATASDTPWKYPPISMLSESILGKVDRGDPKANAGIIESTLEAFGISAKVVEVNLGPAVTQYAIEVAIGTKLSKISALSNDLALALAAPTGQIRIEAPIPGRSLVGIELPNRSPEFVGLRRMLESEQMRNHKSKLAVALGLDVSGKPIIADIAKMPHVLIAGSTGSGKSVCINAFIASLLFRTSPAELNLIMVDPKRVELTGYNGIPHLLSPVIVEPEKVLSALKWLTVEMDRRYKIFAEIGVRNIDAYNESSGFQALPYIVLLIDELADIMLFAPVEVEDAITRLAQMARATGIHLVLATQRPSVDIITGLIKANIPTRIAFAVSSMIDSRVILDQPGAEKLLGRGDMLFVPPDQAKPSRIQGAFVSDKEINSLLDFIRKEGVAPHYTEEVTTMTVGRKNGRGGMIVNSDTGGSQDDLFNQAVQIVVQNDKASASLLQRKLSIGYARAARLLDELEQAGVVGHGDGAKPRDILIKNADEFLK